MRIVSLHYTTCMGSLSVQVKNSMGGKEEIHLPWKCISNQNKKAWKYQAWIDWAKANTLFKFKRKKKSLLER